MAFGSHRLTNAGTNEPDHRSHRHEPGANLFLDQPIADVDAIIFDAPADISSTVQWLSGPCKDSNWSGTFTTEREGKTHKIRLRSGTIATNNAD